VRNGDPRLLQRVLVQVLRVVAEARAGRQARCGRGIIGVVPGDDAEQRRGVGDRAGDRAGVSWSAVIGRIPVRLTRPTVVLIPTTPFADAGLRIEPDVSVPIATVTRFALTPMAEPELEPPVCSAGRPSLNGPSCAGRGTGSTG